MTFTADYWSGFAVMNRRRLENRREQAAPAMPDNERVLPGRECRSCGEDRAAEMVRNSRMLGGVDMICLVCKRERNREYARKRRQDPAVREAEREYDRERRQDPAVREARREYDRARRRDPAVREAEREYDRKRRQDPAVREARREYARKRRQDPAVREARREYVRARVESGAMAAAARAKRARLRARTESELAADLVRLRPDGTKKCRGGHVASVDEFLQDVTTADGLQDYCRPCHGANNAARHRRAHQQRWPAQGVAEDVCYICWAPAEQIEHVIPMASGRGSDEWTLPACQACNLSKNATPLDVWLRRRGVARYSEPLRYALELTAVYLHGEVMEVRTPTERESELG